MLNYAICEISGKQYKVIPGETFEVDLQKESDQKLRTKILLLSQADTIKIGKPYLKEDLTLHRVEDTKGKKIKVSKFHAKANYRRTRGYRSKITQVVLKA